MCLAAWQQLPRGALLCFLGSERASLALPRGCGVQGAREQARGRPTAGQGGRAGQEPSARAVSCVHKRACRAMRLCAAHGLAHPCGCTSGGVRARGARAHRCVGVCMHGGGGTCACGRVRGRIFVCTGSGSVCAPCTASYLPPPCAPLHPCRPVGAQHHTDPLQLPAPGSVITSRAGGSCNGTGPRAHPFSAPLGTNPEPGGDVPVPCPVPEPVAGAAMLPKHRWHVLGGRRHGFLVPVAAFTAVSVLLAGKGRARR